MQLKNNPYPYLWKRVWQFADGKRGLIIIYTILSSIGAGTLLLAPLVLAKLLNTIQAEGVTEANITALLGIVSLFLVVTMLFWLVHGPARIMERYTAFHVRKNYKEHLFKNVLRLPLGWHGDRESGDTIDKIEKGTKALYDFVDGNFKITRLLVQFFGTAFVLFFFNFYSGLTIFIMTILTFAAMSRFDKHIVAQLATLNTYENRISAKIYDVISNVTSVIVLRIQASVLKDVVESIMRPWDLFKRHVWLVEGKWTVGSFVFELSVVIPLALYLYTALDSGAAVEIGTISALYFYLRNMGNVFFTFGIEYERLLHYQAAVSNTELIEADFTDTEKLKDVHEATSSIVIKNLYFSYATDPSESNHLDDVSISITPGERIALVGESGSGKTTFLKVLHGLYPVKADLSVDGVPIHVPLDQIDLGTTLVPQEPELFAASIEENVTLGLDYSQAEVQAALDMARFTEVAMKLPNKLASKINEKGVNLSGGQKQRLALARALLFARDKSIILLDESTSSVDPVNERAIYENIFTHFSAQTIVASIHKLNLLDQFDRVILFESGTVIGDGEVNTLKANNEKFAKMIAEYDASTQTRSG